MSNKTHFFPQGIKSIHFKILNCYLEIPVLTDIKRTFYRLWTQVEVISLQDHLKGLRRAFFGKCSGVLAVWH
jgi:hypothetical protein